QLVLCGVLFRLGAIGFVSWIMPARWSVSALGGVAGLSAARLHQTAGLYPHSAIGLLSTWFMLVFLTVVGLAATAWLLERQGRSWSVGSDGPGRLLPVLARTQAVTQPSGVPVGRPTRPRHRSRPDVLRGPAPHAPPPAADDGRAARPP